MVVGNGIALMLYPGFNITRRTISMLYNGPGRVFYYLGTTLTGVFTLLCVINLGRLINEQNINETLRSTAVFSAIISCTCLIVCGVFCGRNYIIALIHGIFAFINWFFGVIFIALYSILIYYHKRFSKVLAYYGFLLTVFMFLFLILWVLCYIPRFNFLVNRLPLLEWIDTAGIILWYFLVSMSARSLYSKKGFIDKILHLRDKIINIEKRLSELEHNLSKIEECTIDFVMRNIER
jgi:hypothetical protein